MGKPRRNSRPKGTRSRRILEGKQASNQWVVGGYQHELRNSSGFPDVPSFIYDEKGGRGRICLVGEQASWEEDGKKVVRNDLITQDEFTALMKVDEIRQAQIGQTVGIVGQKRVFST